MKFDWYQATIEDDPLVVIDRVSTLGHEVRQADAAARRWRYNQGWEIHHNTKGVVGLVMAGGNGNKPHAIATGEAADEFSQVIREHWLDRHLVTRCDAAQDFNEAGAFERILPVARKVAKEHRLAFPKISDELNARAGRTQYLGSPKSDYRGRLYDKGFEQIGKMQALFRRQGFDMPDDAVPLIRNEATGEMVRPEDWIRLEAQIRPKQEEARRKVATLTPEECWGCSPWMLELARETMALNLQRVVMRTRKISKDEEALRWMCQQYGAMMGRMLDDYGDWACVGLEIGRIVEEQGHAETRARMLSGHHTGKK